ncbi:HD domain-containing protein [Rhizobium laguerreae]|nr:HD domain-containing protein [Rhizobium laguerreae]
MAVTRAEYAKQVNTMRSFLQGKDYHLALAAMEFAMSCHTGTRKDGVSPEFSHQMFIALYVLSITPLLLYPEETLAAVFLHDVCEDYPVTYEEIERLFGKRVREAVELLTKKKDGVRIPDDVYYERMALNEIASIVKGVDRAHNIHSMHSADWSIDKQQAYLDFVFDYVLPMLKKARKKFTRQRLAYENIKSVLLMQARPIQLLLDAKAAPNASEKLV